MAVPTLYNRPARQPVSIVLVEDLEATDLIVRPPYYGQVRGVEVLPRGLVRVSYLSGKAFSFEQGSEIAIRRRVAA